MLVAGLVSAFGRRRFALVVARRRSSVHRILMRRGDGVMQCCSGAALCKAYSAVRAGVARRIDAQHEKLYETASRANSEVAPM